jgi:hypothetical protein
MGISNKLIASHELVTVQVGLDNILVHSLILHVLITGFLRLGFPPHFDFTSKGSTFLGKYPITTVRFLHKIHPVSRIPPSKAFNLICIKGVIWIDTLVAGAE